jgi:hypothetical protein
MPFYTFEYKYMCINFCVHVDRCIYIYTEIEAKSRSKPKVKPLQRGSIVELRGKKFVRLNEEDDEGEDDRVLRARANGYLCDCIYMFIYIGIYVCVYMYIYIYIIIHYSL